MSLEEKVRTLEEKVNKLEKLERRRKVIRWIKFGIKTAILVVICIFVYKGYKYLKDNYIEPVDNLRQQLGEKLDKIKDYDILEKFGLK